MNALDIACRHTDLDGTNCAAEPNEPCMRTSAYGQRYQSQMPHAERIEDAAAMSESSTAVDPALANEAFETVSDRLI
jgi:hypothetical protein